MSLWEREVDNGEDMLKCPFCGGRVILRWYALAIGYNGHRFCPYCGTNLDDEADVTAERPKQIPNDCDAERVHVTRIPEIKHIARRFKFEKRSFDFASTSLPGWIKLEFARGIADYIAKYCTINKRTVDEDCTVEIIADVYLCDPVDDHVTVIDKDGSND